MNNANEEMGDSGHSIFDLLLSVPMNQEIEVNEENEMNQENDVQIDSIDNDPVHMNHMDSHEMAEDEKMEEIEVIDITTMEYEEQYAECSQNNKMEQMDHRNQIEENQMEIGNGDGNNEYILQHADSQRGLSVSWNDTEYAVLERQMESNHIDTVNNGNRDCYRREPEDNAEKVEVAKSSPIKYVETVRGKKRQLLPGHEC